MHTQHTAKVFKTGRSQAVRLPAAYRFDTDEVFIHRDELTGDVVLSRHPDDWTGFFAALDQADIPADFLRPEEREQRESTRDPLDVPDTAEKSDQ